MFLEEEIRNGILNLKKKSLPPLLKDLDRQAQVQNGQTDHESCFPLPIVVCAYGPAEIKLVMDSPEDESSVSFELEF